MPSNLGPAQVSTTIKYAAPNPAETQANPVVTLAFYGLLAWAIFTPTGRADVQRVVQYIRQKFGFSTAGGGTTSGS